MLTMLLVTKEEVNSMRVVDILRTNLKSASCCAQRVATLVQKANKETGRCEWALVSKSNPNKVLEWYGTSKPSMEQVAKTERRVQFFKKNGAYEKHMQGPNRLNKYYIKCMERYPGSKEYCAKVSWSIYCQHVNPNYPGCTQE